MKIIKIIILLIIGFVLGFFYMPMKFKLHEYELKDIVTSSTCDTPPKVQLIKAIKEKGDIDAYKALLRYFSCSVNNENMEEFVPYALLMANKYKYNMAFYHVYDCFISIYADGAYNSDLDSLDVNMRNIALEYLQRGVALKEKNCQRTLGEYYLNGKYLKKDTVLGKTLIDRSWGSVGNVSDVEL